MSTRPSLSERDCADAAQGPDRGALNITSRHALSCSYARLDALADDERGGDAIELDGSALNNAEHATTRLRPTLRLIEANAVDGGDVIVIDRTEGREQRRNAFGAASILVPPRATRVEAQHGTGQ